MNKIQTCRLFTVRKNASNPLNLSVEIEYITKFRKSLRNQKRKQDKKMTKFEKNSRPQRKSPENENTVIAIMITNPKNTERKTKKVEK